MNALHKIELDGAAIEYSVRRSKRRRKTIQISVSHGAVVVSAPMRTPNCEIQAIVQKRAGWIIDKLETGTQEPPPLRLVTGERLPYLGGEVELAVEEAGVRKPLACLEGGHMRVISPPGLAEDEQRESVRKALVNWYRAQAAEVITDSVARWLPVMGRDEMPRVLVREQRTRWGSCSSDGTLRFSWRLAMVEPELIDSVAVHELAHLYVMDHSPAFWEVVLRAMPDARERRKRLADAGRRLPL